MRDPSYTCERSEGRISHAPFIFPERRCINLSDIPDLLYGYLLHLQRILLDNLKQGITFGADELAVEVDFV